MSDVDQASPEVAEVADAVADVADSIAEVADPVAEAPAESVGASAERASTGPEPGPGSRASDSDSASAGPETYAAVEADPVAVDTEPVTDGVGSAAVDTERVTDGVGSAAVGAEPVADETDAAVDVAEPTSEPAGLEDEAAERETGVAEGEAAAGEEGEPAADEEALGFEMPPAMSQMLFVDVVLVLPSTHPVLVLQEADFPYRELRIPIGGPEGIAIGYASRQLPTPRPLTHELMTRLLEGFGLTLDVVRITGMQGGMFTAEIIVSGPTGQRTLDCRPSDAIALALRQAVRVPIVVDADVLERAAGAAAGQN